MSGLPGVLWSSPRLTAPAVHRRFLRSSFPPGSLRRNPAWQSKDRYAGREAFCGRDVHIGEALKPTQKRVEVLLRYNRRTGIFTWKTRRAPLAPAGGIAGRVGASGYREISVDEKRFLASHLAILLLTGAWPTGEVDHRNGVRDDNRARNLRNTTKSGNQQNQRRARSDNRLGLLGVYQRGARFVASIQTDKKRIHLGRFDTPEAAQAAYLAAKRALHATCTI